jgi:AAA domain
MALRVLLVRAEGTRNGSSSSGIERTCSAGLGKRIEDVDVRAGRWPALQARFITNDTNAQLGSCQETHSRFEPAVLWSPPGRATEMPPPGNAFVWTACILSFARHITFQLDAHAAETDPVGFVGDLSERVILDEVQHVPGIFGVLKTAVDRNRVAGRFILTGSCSMTAKRARASEMTSTPCRSGCSGRAHESRRSLTQDPMSATRWGFET